MIGDISQVPFGYDTIRGWSEAAGLLLAALALYLTRRRNARLFVSWTGGILAVAVVAVAWGWTAGLGRVQPGARGVVLRFGAPTGRMLGEGLYYVTPFAERVVQVNTQINSVKFDRIQGTTADLEPVYADMAVGFHVNPDRAVEIYRTLRTNYTPRVLVPNVAEAWKVTVARYNAADLIAKRPDVQAALREEIDKRITPFGLTLDSVATTRFNFAYTYAQAAQLKVAAVQRTLQAEQDLERVKAESQQSIIRAKSEVEALKIQRHIPLEQLIRIRRLDLERRAIDKWDGRLPQSTSALPFLGGTLGQPAQPQQSPG
jgi:regulator of protease activity HflC (stomatin/prohibitin superfamily)